MVARTIGLNLAVLELEFLEGWTRFLIVYRGLNCDHPIQVYKWLVIIRIYRGFTSLDVQTRSKLTIMIGMVGVRIV